MKDNSKKQTWLIVVGLLFVLIGMICNEWLLAALFSTDGVIVFKNRMIIWFFGLWLIVSEASAILAVCGRSQQ